MMQRVLIVKLGAIGDVIMAIPAVHTLHLRGAQIDWVCGSAVAPLLASYPWIRTIVADERAILKGTTVKQMTALARLWKAIGIKNYNLCATLYYDPRYKLLTLPVQAERKVILSSRERALKLLPGRHHTDEYARILLGLDDGERTVCLAPVRAEHLPVSPLARIEGKTRIVLAPGGAKNMMRDDALRRWPAENYVAVARTLVERGFEVVLIGGPDDGWVSPLFNEVRVTDLIGTLTLPETLALLDKSDVIVTHDTGPLHLAGITRVGIVTIFGPTDPRGRLPQRADALAIWGGEGFACRPCYDGQTFAPCKENGCMRQVVPAMVVTEVEMMLAQRAAAESGPPRVITPESTVIAQP
jgi:heptosyltransferase-2